MANERIALVIGNAAYEHATSLKSPILDAAAMEETLQRLGFDVTSATDCNINDFQKMLRDFVKSINGAEAALLYYSGHALQYDGENYLIPIDARVEVPDDLNRLAFPVMSQVERMTKQASVSLVFLDACRDEPFDFAGAGPIEGTKRVVVKKSGLEAIPTESLSDALIAFAAQPGSTAVEGGEGELSPFTKALCEHIETDGLEIKEMVQRVRKSVWDATEKRQRPWSNESMLNQFFFKPVIGVPSPGPRPRPPRPKPKPEKPVSPGPEPTLSSFLPNLAAGIEAVAKAGGPILLGGVSTTIAFLLLLVSQMLDLSSIKLPDSGKEVGFMYAPNWCVVYTVLFPFYLVLFAILTERARNMFNNLVERRIIVGPDGERVSEAKLFAAWKAALQKVSLLLWIMLVIIGLQTGTEWLKTCLWPYTNGAEVVALDWSTAATKIPALSRSMSIMFSGVAYIYMAVALYVYLAILVYAAALCYFLSTVADSTGEFRMVARDGTLGQQLAFVGNVIYWSVILGLGAGFMMRLQAAYLASDHLIVTGLMFNDVWSLLGIPAARSGGAGGGKIPSDWTGLVEMIFTLLILFACWLCLCLTFENARKYYLDNVGVAGWRKKMEVEYSKEQVDELRRQSSVRVVFPEFVHFGIIVAGVFASGLFIGVGAVPLATLAYLLLAFLIFPGFAGARKTGAV